MKILDIRKALVQLIKANQTGVKFIANESKEVKEKRYFIEIVPTGKSKVDKLIDKKYWVYIRCHDLSSTHIERLSTYEELSDLLIQGLNVLDRVLHPQRIGFEEIKHVLEIKFMLEFTDSIDVEEAPMMDKLEMEV